ncbi:hypothetical protein [Nitratifractor sp.]
MVTRIEALVATVLAVLAAAGWFFAQTSASQERGGKEHGHKEIEIRSGIVHEINATGVMNVFESAYAVQERGVWHFRRFRLRNPQIRYLRSDRALKQAQTDRLEGNVTLVRKDGAIVRSQRVLYDEKRRVLRSLSPFVGQKGNNLFRGRRFVYDLNRRLFRARTVYARYDLASSPPAQGR